MVFAIPRRGGAFVERGCQPGATTAPDLAINRNAMCDGGIMPRGLLPAVAKREEPRRAGAGPRPGSPKFFLGPTAAHGDLRQESLRLRRIFNAPSRSKLCTVFEEEGRSTSGGFRVRHGRASTACAERFTVTLSAPPSRPDRCTRLPDIVPFQQVDPRLAAL